MQGYKLVSMIFIIVLMSVSVLASNRQALTSAGFDRYTAERAVIGFLDQNNVWTGENIFMNYTLINYNQFDVTGSVNASEFCISGVCISNWDNVSVIGSGKQGDGIYLTNDSTTIYFDESKLNATIDIRAALVDTDTHIAGDGIYLYNDSTIMYFNETLLNDTIDARASSGNPFDQTLNTTSDVTFSNIIVNGSSGSSFCYQESPTVSDQTGIDGVCDLSYSGTQSQTGTWWQASNAVDGNWGTSGEATSGNKANLFVTYKKPTGATSSSLWQARSGGVIKNITIPSDCWDASVTDLELWMESNNTFGTDSVINYCYNGTAWVSIYSEAATSIQEEAMVWDVVTLNGTITAAYFIGDGSQLTGIPDTDTHVAGDGTYLYNDSTTMYLNETLFNDTIDARSLTDVFVNETGDTMTGNLVMEANITDTNGDVSMYFEDGVLIVEG